MNTPYAHPPSDQKGFSMIEVLVTVVILAVGLLGIAALQFMSKRSNFEAVQRTAATMLAYDIIERMRTNSTQLMEYAGDASTPSPLLGGATQSTPDPNCSTASCTPFKLSQYDLWEWERSLDGASEIMTASGNNTGGLVSPTACITTTVPAGITDRSGEYRIAIAWRGPTPLSDPTISTCGLGSGKYNSEGGGADIHRRVLVVNTFIFAQ